MIWEKIYQSSLKVWILLLCIQFRILNTNPFKINHLFRSTTVCFKSKKEFGSFWWIFRCWYLEFIRSGPFHQGCWGPKGRSGSKNERRWHKSICWTKAVGLLSQSHFKEKQDSSSWWSNCQCRSKVSDLCTAPHSRLFSPSEILKTLTQQILLHFPFGLGTCDNHAKY